MINGKSAREMNLKHLIQGKLSAYSAKISSSSFSSRNHSNTKCPKTSLISHKKESVFINPLKHLQMKMHQNLLHHNSTLELYNIKVINDIIYDEKKHIVCLFKNYLLWDEISDFLKRFYYRKESISRLPKITGYYEKYTLFAPIYYQLDCIKLMMKNIKRKKRYLEMIEENEDKIDLDDNTRRTKEFKTIIKPEDVKTDETIQSYATGERFNTISNNENRDISLTLQVNTRDNMDNTHLSQLISKVINATSLSIAQQGLDENEEISDSVFNMDQHKYQYQSPFNQKANCHIKNKIEMKKLNLNKIIGLNPNYEAELLGKSKKHKANVLARKLIHFGFNDHSKNKPNENQLKDNKVFVDQEGQSVNNKKNQIPSLTATIKGKQKNKIIINSKFTSIDNLFRIMQFPHKQQSDRKESTTSRGVSSKGKEEKVLKEEVKSKVVNPESANLKRKKTNLVINYNTIKTPKPSLALRNSLRSKAKSSSQPHSQSQSKQKSTKKKLEPDSAQKIKKSMHPLNKNALVNSTKAPQNDKMILSFVHPQAILSTNHKPINPNSNKNGSKHINKPNEQYFGDEGAKKKHSNQTQATATASSSKNKDKISYELNNLHLGNSKHINGFNELNCFDNQGYSTQREEKKKDGFIAKVARHPEKKVSRNNKNIIDKLQNSNTNRMKNMVIPINATKEKIPRSNQAKSQPKEKKVDNNRNQLNYKHETSMSVSKNKQVKVEPQRKYPLTSRNEKERIPVQLLNKIMKRKK